MSGHVFRRVFARATRINVQRTSTSWRSGLRRRMASSAGPEESSDTPWLIGAGVVTALGAAYILSPSSKKHAHQSAKAAKAPFEHSLPKKEEKPEPELVKDDEGTVADASESIQKSLDTDSPKDAQAAEKSVARFDEGSAGQTDGGNLPEQGGSSTQTKRAKTLQDKPDGLTDLGDARSEAKEGNAPKEVADKTDS